MSTANLPFDQLSVALAKLRVRKEFLALGSSHRERLIQLSDKHGTAAALQYLQQTIAILGQVSAVYQGAVVFSQPDDWIDTESNVRFEVVEKNCRNLGVEIETLKGLLKQSNMELYPALKDLVDTRNEIAHGNSINPMSGQTWDGLQQFVSALMHSVQWFLYESLLNNAHLAAAV